MTTVRVPPGRAGRQWLRRRLDSAAHAASLLERKSRALREEQHRLELQVHHTGEEWTSAEEAARSWLLRAAMAGGQRGIRLACTAEQAEVTITWATSMGVRYPARAVCALPQAESSLPGSTAVVRAAQEHRAALAAAVRHAVAVAALSRVSAEVDKTRRSVRALRQHWIPRLEEARTRVELALEEQESAEGVRHRWAAGRSSPRGERRQAPQ
ncbi:MAG: V-type ATP synthase subunit D [Umezawaea sp.]